MPAVQAPATVLVTGASGFIAVWVVKTLLDKGFNVRGTVRSSSKGDYLTKLFDSYGEKFTYVIVGDVSHEGAFDEAVKGVDAVIHTASPVSGNAHDPDELIRPAVDGTLNALKSVKKHGGSVRRVVITSSVVALMEPKNQFPAVYTETDWNNFVIEDVKTKGATADDKSKYCASKTLAERAAWDFVKDNTAGINFDIATILPSYVPAPAQLNYSTKFFFDAMQGEGLPQSKASAPFGDYVDVRDVAEMHVRALTEEAAGGERFICSGGVLSWQDVYDTLNSVEPPVPNVPRGHPGRTQPHPAICNADKARRFFGFEFTSLQKMAADTLRSLREREVVWGEGSE
ncbi:hypothetical protein BOTBODRAFT_29275 [Botryobasidium botryosum FD-172 SS1]|uniref:NAD-dependent epimerase/dehydratase domain-containing protein n=1 Tax=Botryobasidium botryosum (strain FD-172 SS1) TaxID=930990 RepID=A0A067N1E1_BOTB1|nr:hypothetical protein BOTBODRAFT_29275 [Botryobasidium botryosum FD-172 SS1]